MFRSVLTYLIKNLKTKVRSLFVFEVMQLLKTILNIMCEHTVHTNSVYRVIKNSAHQKSCLTEPKWMLKE